MNKLLNKYNNLLDKNNNYNNSYIYLGKILEDFIQILTKDHLNKYYNSNENKNLCKNIH